MKKYVVTSKHPYYISGLAFEVYDNQVRFLPSGYYAEDIQPSRIFQWVEDGFIKEIQEPEFTKDNMIEFAEQCITQYRGGLYGVPDTFEKYVKTNNLKR